MVHFPLSSVFPSHRLPLTTQPWWPLPSSKGYGPTEGGREGGTRQAHPTMNHDFCRGSFSLLLPFWTPLTTLNSTPMWLGTQQNNETDHHLTAATTTQRNTFRRPSSFITSHPTACIPPLPRGMWAGFFQNEGYGMGKEELGETEEVEGQQVHHEIGPRHLFLPFYLSFPPLNPLKCIAMRLAGWKRRERWQRRCDHLLEDDNMLTL